MTSLHHPARHRLHAWIGVAALVVGASLVLAPALRSGTHARAAWTLGVATFASEDLASVTAGAMVARGELSAGFAIAGVLAGIFAGDLLLFLAGRVAGRRLLDSRLAGRVVSPDAIRASARWIERRGLRVVLLTRFLPGTRLPTYLAAGEVGTRTAPFAAYFAVAALAWTPVVVGAGWLAGFGATTRGIDARGPVPFALAILVAVASLRLGASLATQRGRRLLVSRWRRLTRWEYWPAWIVYAPVLVTVLRHGLRHRSLTLFTAANPGIVAGGFVGESKFAILQALRHAEAHVPRAMLLEAGAQPPSALERVLAFMERAGLAFPIVLKPDQGQRGSGVVVARDRQGLERALAASSVDTIVQEFVPGVEFGVFYARHPREARGRILSLTEKRLPSVAGDGRRTLERLILDDARAVGMARVFLARHAGRLDDVPAAGSVVALGELGTHSRGALFLDGRAHVTAALEDAVDAVARGTDGFFFGRFDVRAASIDEFRAGRFRIIELNGVTSEATHIYDPAHGLVHAVRTLQAQWRLAFEIGAANRAAGAPVAGLRELAGLISGYRRLSRRHLDASSVHAASRAG